MIASSDVLSDRTFPDRAALTVSMVAALADSLHDGQWSVMSLWEWELCYHRLWELCYHVGVGVMLPSPRLLLGPYRRSRTHHRLLCFYHALHLFAPPIIYSNFGIDSSTSVSSDRRHRERIKQQLRCRDVESGEAHSTQWAWGRGTNSLK